MKQTAVEWYNEEINKLNVGNDARVFIAKLFELAKEIEREQIIDAFQDSRILSVTNNCSSGKQYYNETFKK
jgi:hypothetical protein